MTLGTGTRLGPYEIRGSLGAGGMGEVYRASDTKLKREVAIKVLPEAFARDGERMKRFERESEILASLNHPYIAAIYGVEETNGTRALVLELVEGPTLAERMASARIPMEEALRIALQIAQGVEAAHERAVVHRDLKPANVKLTRDGDVKILDFGLAKALDVETLPLEESLSPTLTRETKVGVLLGTAAYMSPEQAQGKPADRRADVWSFGVVLYEMLTGERAFAGEGVSQTLAHVLTKEPDWGALPPMQRDSIFRICSMTKPITSVAAMILYEEGRFLLDDPISRYLPEFKNPKVLVKPASGKPYSVPATREITVRDLLRHTAGLTYHWNEDLGAMYNEAKVAHGILPYDGTIADSVRSLAALPLLVQPGEKSVYSLSVDVLGRLVEVVSGKTLDEFFRARIFDPLGMKDTSFYPPEDKLARLAAAYTYYEGKGLNRFPDTPSRRETSSTPRTIPIAARRGSSRAGPGSPRRRPTMRASAR